MVISVIFLLVNNWSNKTTKISNFFESDVVANQKLSFKIFYDKKNTPPFGTIFSLKTKQGNIVASAGFIRYWNTYSGYQPGEMSFFVKQQDGLTKKMESNFKTIGKPSKKFKTGFSFVKENCILFKDMANGNVYKLDDDKLKINTSLDENLFQLNNDMNYDNKFYANGFIFGLDNNFVVACKDRFNKGDCFRIEIYKGTWPYIYAENNGKVIAITNYGSILIFDGKGWCQASEHENENYYCDEGLSKKILDKPRGKQFYSSIYYDGKTLIGAWPTGRLYEFDGKVFKPSLLSPFLEKDYADREAQSMAIYGGNLYVGYWPRGEIMIYDHESKSWSLSTRLFSHPVEEDPFIPYLGQLVGEESAFLGQRVTSLVAYSNKLFATTSNLRGWGYDIKNPDFLTNEQIDEYGRIYSLEKPGCLNTFLNITKESTLIDFIFDKDKVVIKEGDRIIGQVLNPGFSFDDGLSLVLEEGIFGEFNGQVEILEN
ncbi:MAG: hypothetical protein PHP97_01320 [Candidatus Shapirobacteria bacterium]|nr:hypothetical protein [Candidatus Shapirobacteria bacterium]MDD4383223.1 hypothetical protein [Candidatus Shapirobacteria bacterium]